MNLKMIDFLYFFNYAVVNKIILQEIFLDLFFYVYAQKYLLVGTHDSFLKIPMQRCHRFKTKM